MHILWGRGEYKLYMYITKTNLAEKHNQPWKCETYIQSCHEQEHLGGKQKEHEQTLQSLIYHCALYQTSRIPERKKIICIKLTKTTVVIVQ